MLPLATLDGSIIVMDLLGKSVQATELKLLYVTLPHNATMNPEAFRYYRTPGFTSKCASQRSGWICGVAICLLDTKIKLVAKFD